MPRTIVLESPIERTARVVTAEGMFDVPPSERSRKQWEVDLPLNHDWNIGMIVGPSGCGKSTVAREFWPEELLVTQRWPKDRSVLDGFAAKLGVSEIVELLTAVGFGSPPSWLRPYRALSSGEQFRVSIARALSESTDRICVIDEFTSVVDRQVAEVASHAVQKAVRRREQQLVAVSCHYDIIDWLQPDWIYQPHKDEFAWRHLQRHPGLRFDIAKANPASWRVFGKHHYMSPKLHPAAQCFGGWIDDEMVCFAAYLHFPHRSARNIKIGHRLVVLPDFQGLGLGGRMHEFMGQWLYDRGYRYHNVIAHPAMIAYYLKSPRWIEKSKQTSSVVGPNAKQARRHQRMRALGTRSFEYVPKPKRSETTT